MKRLLRGAAVALLVLLILAAIGSAYLLLLQGRPPAKRPDLVRLPAGTPPAPRGYPTVNALYLSFLLGRVNLIDLSAGAAAPASVVERVDVEYGRVGDRPLLLDLYSPRKLDRPVPALLFSHGGGWEIGDKSDYKIYNVAFAEKGYVTASIGYRLMGEAPFPACVQDVKCAVRWIRKNAEDLHVDPDRIVVLGGSAGGHLSMMIGYASDVPELEGDGGNADVSSSVAAVVNLYGPTDLTTPYARVHGLVERFIGAPYEEAAESYRLASPLHHLDAADPPTLIIQGTIDDLVPVFQADRLAERCQELGIPYWYDRLDGWPHTLDLNPDMNARCQDLIDAFVRKHVGAP